MTRVQLKRVPIQTAQNNTAGYELQLIVKGHTGYAVLGRDIVCAGISILVQGFAAFLAGAAQEFLYDFAVEGMESDGSVMIVATPTTEGWHYICGAFENTAMGFFLLAQAYPKHVELLLTPHTTYAET